LGKPNSSSTGFIACSTISSIFNAHEIALLEAKEKLLLIIGK
jgi:hypothetical protein